jgi:alpha-beta hydrolase superfamily lysophospholipase
MTQRYGEIKSEVLIIWGENDPWLPVEFGRRLKSKIRASTLEVIEECGHLPHQEKPDIVNPLMIGFLNANKDGSRFQAAQEYETGKTATPMVMNQIERSN